VSLLLRGRQTLDDVSTQPFEIHSTNGQQNSELI
jgi:hypothetical protein